MKRTIDDIIQDLDGARHIASWNNKKTFVVKSVSTDYGVASDKEMIRGDYDTVKAWCIDHVDDPGFDSDYVHQYFIYIAD